MNTTAATVETSATTTSTRTRLLQLSEPVNVALEQNGKPVQFNEYGEITSPLVLGVVTLTVAMPLDYPVIGFQIDESTKTVKLLDNEGSDTAGSVFRKKITVRRTEDGTTLYPDLKESNIRWVEICRRQVTPTEIGVVVKMFVAALVSQAGTFFLTYQEMFSEEAILWNGTVKIPGLGRSKAWRDLGKFLEQQLGDLLESGLQFREREDVEFATPKHNQYNGELAKSLPNNIGIVQWYSLRMQNGAILTNRGAVRAHWSQVMTERPDGLMYLVESEKVTFKALTPAHRGGGRRSEFTWEAQGIELAR